MRTYDSAVTAALNKTVIEAAVLLRLDWLDAAGAAATTRIWDGEEDLVSAETWQGQANLLDISNFESTLEERIVEYQITRSAVTAEVKNQYATYIWNRRPAKIRIHLINPVTGQLIGPTTQTGAIYVRNGYITDAGFFETPSGDEWRFKIIDEDSFWAQAAHARATDADQRAREPGASGALGTDFSLSGGNVSWGSHGFVNTTTMRWVGDDADVPSPCVAGSDYFVVAAGAGSFGLAETVNGSALSLSGGTAGVQLVEQDVGFQYVAEGQVKLIWPAEAK